MITARYFNEEPLSRVIGPQLGPIFEQCGIEITIGLPHRPDITSLRCGLFDANGNLIVERSSNQLSPTWRHFLFEFVGLTPGAEYQYKFFWEHDQPLELEGGLQESDCRFRAPQFGSSDRFVLLSCNNPFYSKKAGEARFAMWDRLLERVAEDDRIKLVVQGGDQVYHDDIEIDCIDELKSPTALTEQNVVRNIIRSYQHYYAHLSYRKIMASIPSVAMLDDHDITGGWGGRPDSFMPDKTLRPEWAAYFRLAYDAFLAYQTSKNPAARIHQGVETTFLDFGTNRLYLLDLRKEKNIYRLDEPLMSRAHQVSLLSSLGSIPSGIAKVFVLSPVVPVRVNPAVEDAMGGAAQLAFMLRGRDCRHEKLHGFGQSYTGLQAWADSRSSRTISVTAYRQP